MRSGTLTVAGTTTTAATSVTVNTSNALLYADYTFASTNQPVANGNNTYIAIAINSAGLHSANSVAVNLPATVVLGMRLKVHLAVQAKRCLLHQPWQNTEVIMAKLYKRRDAQTRHGMH